MQQIFIDSSKPDGQQETIVDLTDAEIVQATSYGIALQSTITAQTAKEMLSRSDFTILRCVENQIPVPSEWASYRQSLRSIISSGQGDLITQPAYPQGT